MAKKKSLDLLFFQYDKARNDAQEAERVKKECSEEIKEALGDETYVDSPEYVVTYRFDKDKETETFDEELMITKAPKEHDKLVKLQAECDKLTKKYTNKKTVPGARKLIVTRKEAE
jgi:hypothetical protein